MTEYGKYKEIEDELSKLINEGNKLMKLLSDNYKFTKNYYNNRHKFALEYQNWYTKSLPVVLHLLSDRLIEFKQLYHLDERDFIDESTYTIEDYVQGLQIEGYIISYVDKITWYKLRNQVFIVKSAFSRLNSILSNIQGILQADLFDTEIEAAKELYENGHLRAAGAVTGVILEKHLSDVCEKHNLQISKVNPTISDFNDALRNIAYDKITWRKIQQLGDIRNLCSHSKEREPVPDEIDELIEGVHKFIRIIS